MQPLPLGKGSFYSSAIADLVDWVKESNPTMRNDNLIINLLLSLSISLRRSENSDFISEEILR